MGRQACSVGAAVGGGVGENGEGVAYRRNDEGVMCGMRDEVDGDGKRREERRKDELDEEEGVGSLCFPDRTKRNQGIRISSSRRGGENEGVKYTYEASFEC